MVDAGTAVEMAMQQNTPRVTRMALIAAERSGADNVAAFDRHELLELMSEGIDYRMNSNKVRGTIDLCERIGYFLPNSNMRAVRINPEHFRSVEDGLRLVEVIDERRALAECGAGHRAVFAVDRLERGTATCATCRR